MKDYLLNNPEKLKELLVKYRGFMAAAKFTVEDLMSFDEYSIQELLRFNPDNFYRDYIVNRKHLQPILNFEYPSSQQLFDSYSKLILCQDILKSGMLRQTLTEVTRMAMLSEDVELASKLDSIVDSYQQPKAESKYASAFDTVLGELHPDLELGTFADISELSHNEVVPEDLQKEPLPTDAELEKSYGKVTHIMPMTLDLTEGAGFTIEDLVQVRDEIELAIKPEPVVLPAEIDLTEEHKIR